MRTTSYPALTTSRRSSPIVSKAAARGAGQRGDGVRRPVDHVLQRGHEGLADLADRVDHRRDRVDDRVGHVLEELDDRLVVGLRCRWCRTRREHLCPGVAQPEQHLTQRGLVVAAVLLDDEIAHQQPRLCTRELADRVYDAAGLSLLPVALDQGPSLRLLEPGGALKELAMLGRGEVLGVHPSQVRGLRLADGVRVLEGARQLDRLVVELPQSGLQLDPVLHGYRGGDGCDPVHVRSDDDRGQGRLRQYGAAGSGPDTPRAT